MTPVNLLPASDAPAAAAQHPRPKSEAGPVIRAQSITLGRPANGRLRVVFFENPRWPRVREHSAEPA